MKRFFLGILLTTILVLPVTAQGNLTRVKGKIVDFDGLTFHLAPPTGPQLAIRLQAATQFMTMEQRALSAIKVGAYAGATVSDTGGKLAAEEVHLYPDAMRGSSEGRIGLGGGRFVVTGAVTAIASGSLTLFYRGAKTANGVCLDRADPKAASPACTADAVIQVPTTARVTALAPANRLLLVPGATATVTVQTDASGNRSTPGLILEKP
jgi:hypothetical protein